MQLRDYVIALNAGAKALRDKASELQAAALAAQQPTAQQFLDDAAAMEETARRIDVIAGRLPEFVANHLRAKEAEDALAAHTATASEKVRS